MSGRHLSRGPRLSVWPPLAPTIYLRARSSPPFPLDQPACRLFARARHGLWHGLRALGLRPGEAVLAPAYHHGSEIEAIRAAGLRCVFYDLTADLAPDAAQLQRLLAPGVRALHLTHYFGFPQDSRWWRRWCDERGLLLVEDAAQAWLAQRDGEPVGTYGDLAIFCLYKTFGLPDGAAVLCRARVEAPSMKRPIGALGLARRHLAWAAQFWPGGLEGGSGAPYDAAADFALGDPRTPAALSTSVALARLTPLAAEARRQRYRRLAAALRRLIPAPFDVLPAGASPFLLPIQVADKSRLLAALAEHRLHAVDVWAVPHPLLPPAAFPTAQRLRQHLVGLPVHQELRPAHVRRIADLVVAVDTA